jgi:pimeloyl-ACP methyl ester carboxylesterase
MLLAGQPPGARSGGAAADWSPSLFPTRCLKRHGHPPVSTTARSRPDLDAESTMIPRRSTTILAVALCAPAAALASACGTSDRPAVQKTDAAGRGAPADTTIHRGGGPALARCSGLQVPSARCGSVEVPLDRGNPGAGTTRVSFALLPRRDRTAPPAGTLLFNPGGPGISAIAQVAKTARQFAPLLDRRDLLVVDPRGTGRSGALRCRALDAGVAFAPRAAFVAAIGACGRELGSHASYYGSAAVADDLEAVRAALGLDRLDLWGASYGTYLMQVYAARHPDHVQSIVLSGAYPIKFDAWGRDRLRAARRAIHLVCARTSACSGAAVLRDIGVVAARLRHRPVTFTIAAGAHRFPVRLDEAALAALVYTNGEAALFGALPAAVASGRAGDLAPLQQLVKTSLLAKATLFDPRVASVISPAQSFGTQCHDYPRAYSSASGPPARRASYQRALAAIDPRAFRPFSPAAWTSAGFEATDTCIEWPGNRRPAAPLRPRASMPDVPVLVLAGDLDANTPSSAGRQVARQFPRATFAVIPNAGHTPTDSQCGLQLGLHFVATSTVRANGCAGTGTPPPIAHTNASETSPLG